MKPVKDLSDNELHTELSKLAADSDRVYNSLAYLQNEYTLTNRKEQIVACLIRIKTVHDRYFATRCEQVLRSV